MAYRYPDATGSGTWYVGDDYSIIVRFSYHADAHGVRVTDYAVEVRDDRALTQDQLTTIARHLISVAEQEYGERRAKGLGEHTTGTLTLRRDDGSDITIPNVTLTKYRPDIAEAITTDTRSRRRRRWLTEERLTEVASVYRANPRAPRKAVCERFQIPRTTADRWVQTAREAGLIPPVGVDD